MLRQRAAGLARGICSRLLESPHAECCGAADLILRQASERGCSTSAPDRAPEPSKSPTAGSNLAVLRYRNQLSGLRKQWAEENEKRGTARELKKQKGIATQQRQQAANKRAEQQQKQSVAAERSRQQAVMQEIQAARRAQAQDWRVVTGAIHEKLDQERHQDLLNWSRTWITKDTLEARIQEALDNPVPLFPGEEDLVDSGFALETEDDDDEPPEAAVRRVAARDDPEAADRDVMEEGSDAMGSNRPRTQHDLR